MDTVCFYFRYLCLVIQNFEGWRWFQRFLTFCSLLTVSSCSVCGFSEQSCVLSINSLGFVSLKEPQGLSLVLDPFLYSFLSQVFLFANIHPIPGQGGSCFFEQPCYSGPTHMASFFAFSKAKVKFSGPCTSCCRQVARSRPLWSVVCGTLPPQSSQDPRHWGHPRWVSRLASIPTRFRNTDSFLPFYSWKFPFLVFNSHMWFKNYFAPFYPDVSHARSQGTEVEEHLYRRGLSTPLPGRLDCWSHPFPG